MPRGQTSGRPKIGDWRPHVVSEQRVERRRDVGREGERVGRRVEPLAQGRRHVHDQRHLQHLGVDRVGVPQAALLAERVAVVGGEDDDALVVETARLQVVDEPAEAAVEAADARGVGRVEAVVAGGVEAGGALAIEHRHVDVLRQRPDEGRRPVGRDPVEPAAQFLQRRAEAEVGDAAPLVERLERRRRAA